MRARMAKMQQMGLATCQRGATAVEYGLIAAILVLGMLIAFQTVASKTIDMWSNVANRVSEN
ncbi:Flp family type IVb pilin [Sphingobium algorifonticola]|uniref:Flp family type IVb pilin n=1 Tax=Sphingobium algorifonticola TaxID=2008318 RepID=A0A437J5F8_9SPHN|nr:Flp family type IVb pilin [Sphingobium algorifonticola]RVT40165.1 Flp family type IVb pilin [Sphingobium algorifonticola]